MPFELPSFSPRPKNFQLGRNIEYSTDNVATANSLASVQDFVRKARRLQDARTRHCFNRIADSTQQLLTTDFAHKAPAIESAARTISSVPAFATARLTNAGKERFRAAQSRLLARTFPSLALSPPARTVRRKNGNLSTVVTGS